MTKKIKVDLPSTVEYQGKKWKVVCRKLKGQFACYGSDDKGNPMTKFAATKWVNPAKFVTEQDKLEEKYGDVELLYAHDITTLFREVINKDALAKDVDYVNLQRVYKNGKWSDMNPIDEMAEMDAAERAAPDTLKPMFTAAKQTWSKMSKRAKIAAMIVGTAILLAAIALIGFGVKAYLNSRGA